MLLSKIYVLHCRVTLIESSGFWHSTALIYIRLLYHNFIYYFFNIINLSFFILVLLILLLEYRKNFQKNQKTFFFN